VQYFTRRGHRCTLISDELSTFWEAPFDFRCPPVLRLPTTYATSTARHKEHSRHTSLHCYSVTSGFITKVPRVCEALVEL